MRASLLTRAASVAAAAVIAATGAMATAGAAGASPAQLRRLPTHLSVAKARAVEHHKHVTVIGGRLTSYRTPIRGKLIFLDRVTGRHWLVIVGREHTNRFGVVAFVVDPRTTAHFALVFPGTPNFHSSHSRAVTVRG